MPVQIQSIAALTEALAQSSGELWIYLITATHASLGTPLRLACPATASVVSQGRTFTATRFDIVITAESFETAPRAELVIDAVDGTLLQTLQVLDPSPLVDIELITASEPNIIQAAQRGLEFARLSVEGVRSMSIELSSESVFSAPFPGVRMTRDRVPGIFTDL
jgi:hypothetical protein